MILSFLNQKGGVGKTTIARAVGVEFVKNNWDVHVADLDRSQKTFFEWAQLRKEDGKKPPIEVAVYGEPKTALKNSDNTDLLLIDGKAFADKHVIEIAEASDLIIIPVGISFDDVKPSLELAVELTNKDIPREKMVFVVCKVPEGGDKEAMKTRKTITNWGFDVVQGWIPFKAAYSQAMDKGLSLTETPFKSLREKADGIIQQIVDRAMLTQQENAEEGA